VADRVLGPVALLALGLNGVVGVGIFFLPATLAARAPGSAGLLVLASTALALAPVAFTFAALARRFDQDGGPVLYARAAFGDTVAFLVGWIAFLSALASSSAVLAGLCRYSVAAWMGLSGAPERAAAVALALALAALASLGLRLSAGVWSFLTVAKLAPLVALVALSWGRGGGGAVADAGVPGAGSWASAALAATFAFQGFEVVPMVAGHARESARHVPRAMVGALGLAALLYVLLHRACLAALPGLAGASAPLSQAAGALGGAWWGALLGAATNVSALGIAFGMVTMTPRYLAALGPELGAALQRESGRGVPRVALGVATAMIVALLAAGSLGELLALSSVAVLAQYGVTSLALLRLAWRRERGLQRRDAWPAPLALGGALLLGSGASRQELLVALGAVVVGVLLRRRTPPRSRQEGASDRQT
jgi:amino acid transporter